MTGPRLLIVIAMAVATMCAALMFAVEPYEEAVREVIRWTARSSLVLFALAYVARPATVLWPRPLTKRLLRERKWIGDGFAVSHVFHLAAIIALASLNWDAFLAGQDPTVIVASVMFVILFAMAITSIDRVRKTMSKRAWNALHRTGMHLAWIVFAFSYVGRIPRGAIWTLPVVMLAAIAAIRVAAWRATSAKRTRHAERRRPGQHEPATSRSTDLSSTG